MEGIKNYHVAVKEWGDRIIFLRKIVEGGTNRSYGIQVAQDRRHSGNGHQAGGGNPRKPGKGGI